MVLLKVSFPLFLFSCNQLNQEPKVSYSLKDQANINAVWASAIIEECTRLGLTVSWTFQPSDRIQNLDVFFHNILPQYFCVAPGSRSSHLAIAAANHPLTTCLACFDERSLAFHAIGYAKGSLKPAVIITSSGTAVSNLLPAVRVLLIYASPNFLLYDITSPNTFTISYMIFVLWLFFTNIGGWGQWGFLTYATTYCRSSSWTSGSWCKSSYKSSKVKIWHFF